MTSNYDPIVTLFDDIKRIDQPARHVSVSNVFKEIEGGLAKDKILEIRDLTKNDPERAKELKHKLPAIAFSGKLDGRKKADFQEHSGLICFDYDGVEGGVMILLKEFLRKIEWVYGFFDSPSGNGLKVVVNTAASNADEHKRCWDAVAEELKRRAPIASIDPAPKSEVSLCFFSHDPYMFWSRTLPSPFPLPPISVNSVSSINSGDSGDSISSVDSKDSISQPRSSWEVRAEAEEKQKKLPSAVRKVWAKYVEDRAVKQGRRHEFLQKLVPPIYKALAPDIIKDILSIHYDIHLGIWKSTKAEHMTDIRDMLKGLKETYPAELNTREREEYSKLPNEKYRFAFRLLQDLSKQKKGQCHLSCHHLGERLGIHVQEAKRILKGMQGEGLISIIEEGTPYKKGTQRKATLWAWDLHESNDWVAKFESNSSSFSL